MEIVVHQGVGFGPSETLVALSELSDPPVGLELISAKGTPGVLREIREMTARELRLHNDTEPGDRIVRLEWSHGGVSEFPLLKMEHVKVKPGQAPVLAP